MASTPIAAANIASSTRMPVTRTNLSCDPKAEMAKFFTGGGVKSMATLPTAATGEPCGAGDSGDELAYAERDAAVIRPVTRPRRVLREPLPAGTVGASRRGRSQGSIRSL